MDWLWVAGTKAYLVPMQQLWTLMLEVTTKKDTAWQAGFVATKAEDAKSQKHCDLQSNYHFQPVAIETTGTYNKFTQSLPLFSFFSDLVKKPVDVSGDPREHKWLYQRQSLAVVRGNTASILYWPVCKFDLILHYVAFNALTSIAACHLPLY